MTWHAAWIEEDGPLRPARLRMNCLQAPTMKAPPKIAKRRRTRGAVMVEYAFLLLAFGIPAMTGTIAAGVQLVKGYTVTRNLLLHVGP
jgi:hypothetical protein